MVKHWLSILAAIIAGFVTTYALYIQVNEREDLGYAVKYNIEESNYKLEKLQAKLENVLSEKIAQAPKSVELAALDQKFDSLEKKILNVEEKTLGLRQAINPSKPEEILTIARLTDEVSSIKMDLEDLNVNLTYQQKVFHDSVLREIKSSSDSTTLILVVLVPLVLNFLYTVWKDIKSEKKE